MARLTQKERRAALAALRLLQCGEWSCDFDPDKPDPFNERHIQGAIEKIEAGLKNAGTTT